MYLQFQRVNLNKRLLLQNRSDDDRPRNHVPVFVLNTKAIFEQCKLFFWHQCVMNVLD